MTQVDWELCCSYPFVVEETGSNGSGGRSLSKASRLDCAMAKC